MTSFDPAIAWARLSPAQQKSVGELAVRLAVVGNRLNYKHNFTYDERCTIECLESDILTAFNEGTEPPWADFYGWRPN